MHTFSWREATSVPSRTYTCGYCGASIASQVGWQAILVSTPRAGAFVYICHRCSRPTFFDDSQGGKQMPGVVFGNAVQGIPDSDTETLYNEARACTGAGCFTAAVLSCRKLLMHVAVALGATAGESFVSYVQFLADNHYVPPGAKGWVDHIRKKGNEANHEIALMSKDDAEELLAFAEMLLKVIYEFPASVQKKLAP